MQILLGFITNRFFPFSRIIHNLPLAVWGLVALNLALMLLVLTWYWGEVMVLSSAFLVMSLGLRHAFDADHIAAIDGATRKFLAQNTDTAKNFKHRLTLASKIGGYFALGHTGMLFFLVVMVVMVKNIGSQTPWVQENCLNGWCAIISEWAVMLILYALAVSNIWLSVKLWRKNRGGASSHHMAAQGWLSRGLLFLWRAQLRPIHMVGIGTVFGLGFDTATELAMIKIAADAATQTAPWLNWLIFPCLFGASMSLADAMNGAMMGKIYQKCRCKRGGNSEPFYAIFSILAAHQF